MNRCVKAVVGHAGIRRIRFKWIPEFSMDQFREFTGLSTVAGARCPPLFKPATKLVAPEYRAGHSGNHRYLGLTAQGVDAVALRARGAQRPAARKGDLKKIDTSGKSPAYRQHRKN
jgi:hypothetical protein